MKKVLRYLAVAILLALVLIAPTSCSSTSSQASTLYDAGAGNFTATGSQFAQYFLYHFDTADAGRTLTLPSAADIITTTSSPAVGEVLIFGVAADGANSVTLVGGTNVTVRPSAAKVAPNTTLTIYYEFSNVTSGNEAVTVY